VLSSVTLRLCGIFFFVFSCLRGKHASTEHPFKTGQAPLLITNYATRLEAAGMSGSEAAGKAKLFDRARGALQRLAGRAEPASAWFVPGRLEVLGKHTDYAGGRSLLCAIERGHCMIAAPRVDMQVRLVDAADGSVVTLALDAKSEPDASGWATYPATVIRRLARNFPEARRGADIAFQSDLPAAAGMSSSSALMIAAFLALADLNRIDSLDPYRCEIRSREDLAGYLATVENGQDFGSLTGGAGVGTFGGSEDHTAILCCEPGLLAQYIFGPVRRERSVQLAREYAFAVAASGIAAEKTAGARDAYNRAATMVREIVEMWRAETGRDDRSLGAAIDGDATAPDRIRQLLKREITATGASRQLLDRFEQFFEESETIIPAVTGLLASGDVGRIGPLVDRSQQLAERLLGNQISETTALARTARELGAVASSAFGAGFGGSVWALIRGREGDEFIGRWAAAYRRQFPAAAANAQFLISRPGPAALRVSS